MDVNTINKKFISGFLSLTFRQTILLGINFFTINIILARALPVEIIGIFNIGNTILSFFTYFSDIGLAAALIQKKEITDDDLESTFLIQEFLAIIIAFLVWVSAEFFAQFYKLDVSGIWLIRALGIAFFMSSLKVIPSIRLERNLQFGPIVLVDIIESIFYNGSLIFLSLSGYGINAFTISTLVRSMIGVLAIYIIAPWKINLGFSKSSLKQLLNFGVPFQLNSLLALVKDRFVPLVIANIIGPLGVGYVSWAQNLAFLPLLLMGNLIRITFPAYSRLQHDQSALKKTVERSIFLTSLITFPLIFGILAITPSLIEHVVTDKWKPALLLVYLFSINTFWATLSTNFTNVLNAIGKIRITLYLMLMWTSLTWVLSPVLAIYYGFLGVGIASAIISFTSIIPIYITKKMIKIEILKNISEPFFASVMMMLITYFIAMFFAREILSTLIIIVISGLIYLTIVFLITREKILSFVKGAI